MDRSQSLPDLPPRRRLVPGSLLVLLLLLIPSFWPATASPPTVNCSDGRVILLPSPPYNDVASCQFSVSCPANGGQVCRWTMTAQSFGGIGLVSAILSSPNGVVVSCSGTNECTHSILGFTLPPNSSIGMTCRSGTGDIAVQPTIKCAATAA